MSHFTVQHWFRMPILGQEMTKTALLCFHTIFDLRYCYWQAPLDPFSQLSHYFVPSDGIHSPTCMLHGTTKANMYLETVQTCYLSFYLCRAILCFHTISSPTPSQFPTVLRVYYNTFIFLFAYSISSCGILSKAPFFYLDSFLWSSHLTKW